MRTWALLAAVVACSGPPPGREPRPPAARPQVPDPVVDPDCLIRARAGTLNEGLATEAARFAVTPVAHTGAHLHQAGRPLTDAESERLWSIMSKEVFAAGGLASGNSGRSSIYTCDDVPKLSCFKLAAYTCQVGVAELAARVERALTAAGVADAELSVDVTYMERGPRCKRGAACAPAPHYSTARVRYDPSKPRRGDGWGRGTCEDDGDCEGADSNHCVAWYLAGGAETLEYQQRGGPTFCGCVRSRCTWFAQD